MDAGESLDGFSLLRHARASGPCAPPVLQQYLLKKRTSFLPRGTRKKFKLHNSECDAHEIEEISTYWLKTLEIVEALKKNRRRKLSRPEKDQLLLNVLIRSGTCRVQSSLDHVILWLVAVVHSCRARSGFGTRYETRWATLFSLDCSGAHL